MRSNTRNAKRLKRMRGQKILFPPDPVLNRTFIQEYCRDHAARDEADASTTSTFTTPATVMRITINLAPAHPSPEHKSLGLEQSCSTSYRDAEQSISLESTMKTSTYPVTVHRVVVRDQ